MTWSNETYNSRQIVPELIDVKAPLLDSLIGDKREEIWGWLEVICGCVIVQITTDAQAVNRDYKSLVLQNPFANRL